LVAGGHEVSFASKRADMKNGVLKKRNDGAPGQDSWSLKSGRWSGRETVWCSAGSAEACVTVSSREGQSPEIGAEKK
jgi:hypothetical protein